MRSKHGVSPNLIYLQSARIQFVFDARARIGKRISSLFRLYNTRLWPAFGRQSLVWSSFEYSYTRLASRLRRSARSLNTERKCLETAETTKSLNTERKCLETAEPTKSLNTERKCLETGKRQNPLNTESVLKQGKNNKTFCWPKKMWQTGGTEWHGGHWLRKVSGNRETTKSLEYGKCQKRETTKSP